MKRASGKKSKRRQAPSPDGGTGRSPYGIAVAIFLFLAVLAAYLPALRAGFIWDDPEYVLHNPTLRSFDGLIETWTRPTANPQYYPMVFTAFWVEYRLWGLNPHGYHLVNVLLHALAAVLLYKSMRRLSIPGATAAAALFALHPLAVESVAWITERKNVLSLVFYLLSFDAYFRFALPGLGSSPRKKDYVLSLVFFLFALLSKTVTCTLPAAVLLVLWWKKERIRWRDLVRLLPFFALGVGLGLVTAWLERTHVGAAGDEWSLSFLERILLAGRIPWFYALKLVWPSKLCFVYPRWVIDGTDFLQFLYPLGLAAVVLALVLLRRSVGKGPLAAVLFFLGSLTPALGFFNVFPMRFSFVADHFQYHAGMGLFVLIASVGAGLLRRRPAIGVAVLALLLAVLGTLTHDQCRIYKDQETLWKDTLAKNPGAWIAHSNLAEILFDQGRVDAAMEHCKRALELKPDLPEALGNMANVLFAKGRYEEAEETFEEVIRLDPGNAVARGNLGATLERLGRLEEAVDRLREAVEINPTLWKARYTMANVLVKLRQYDEAVSQYGEVLRLNPGYFEARYRQGVVLQALGRKREAAEQLGIALPQTRLAGREELAREIEERLWQLR